MPLNFDFCDFRDKRAWLSVKETFDSPQHLLTDNCGLAYLRINIFRVAVKSPAVNV